MWPTPQISYALYTASTHTHTRVRMWVCVRVRACAMPAHILFHHWHKVFRNSKHFSHLPAAQRTLRPRGVGPSIGKPYVPGPIIPVALCIVAAARLVQQTVFGHRMRSPPPLSTDPLTRQCSAPACASCVHRAGCGKTRRYTVDAGTFYSLVISNTLALKPTRAHTHTTHTSRAAHEPKHISKQHLNRVK